MTASHNQRAQARASSAQKDSNWKFDFQYTTTGDASYAVVYDADGHDSVAGVVAYESLEELEQTMERTRIYDHEPTYLSDARSTGSTLACSTSAASTDVNRGSLDDTTANRSTASGLTVSSLDTHDRASGYSYSDYPAVPAGQGPSRFNYTSLGGSTTHPNPLEMWTGTYERHELLAYRLEQPPARKHKANKKRH